MRPAKRGGGRAVLLALVAVLLLALVGVGAGVYFLARPAGEVERFEQAKKDFESRKYTDAARSFAKLAEDFASHREEYRLLADLATLRSETDSISLTRNGPSPPTGRCATTRPTRRTRPGTASGFGRRPSNLWAR
jgi:hypothetical protein